MPKKPVETSPLAWMPPTCTAAEMGALIGVSPRTVFDLATRKIVLRANKEGRFRTKASLDSYHRHLREQAAGRAGEDGLNLSAERARTEKLKQQDLELSLRERRGEMISVDQVREGWSRMATIFRTMVMGLPGRVRAAVPHLTPHDAETMKAVCRDALQEAAEELAGGAVPGADGPKDLSDDCASNA